MKTIASYSASIFLLLLCAISLNAQTTQWEHFPGPEGGYIYSIATAPNGIMFATVGDVGLFNSTDGGASWTPVAAQSPFPGAARVHVTSAGTLLAATPDSMLYRSTDLGTTWDMVAHEIEWNIEPVNDSSGGVIYTDADAHRITRSSDDGVTWNAVGSPIEDYISRLAVGADGRLVMAIEGTGFPSVRSIRVSSDLGLTWNQVPLHDENTYPVESLGATPDGYLFAGTGNQLFRSTDGGATWAEISIEDEVSYNYSAFAVPGDGSIVLATSRGMYRSTNKGTTWQPFGRLTLRQSHIILNITPQGKLIAGTYESGIYLMDGTDWKHSSQGLPQAGAGEAVVGPDRTIYTIAANGRFFSSDDNGTTWLEPDINRYFNPTLAVDADGKLYAGNVFYSAESGLVTSTDRGETLNSDSNSLAGEWAIALLVGRHGDIYAGVERSNNVFHHSESDGLFHSTDHGASWTTLGTGLQGTTPRSIVELADGTLFIGCEYERRVMMLAPGASVWQEKSVGLPQDNSTFSNPLTALIADRRENLYAGLSQGLFRSTNRGTSWQRIGLSIPDTAFTALALSPAGTLFAATQSSGVYSSDDNGATWQQLGAAPGITGYQMLAVDSSSGLIAGNDQTGLYRTTITSSVPVAGSHIAAGLAVHPNPAGLHTTVEFDIAAAGTARLVLYTTIGQQLAIVSEGELAPGSHRFALDMTRYAPGVYLLRLETGRGSEQVGVVIAR
jgi:photosystem II stability/assembly factor-like uncharacterized protein